MNPEIKKKWVAALRSGNFEQGTGYLVQEPFARYCCLGVLCVVNGFEPADDEGEVETNKIPKDLANIAELPFAVCDKLAEMNDGLGNLGPQSFTQIANWIEKNL